MPGRGSPQGRHVPGHLPGWMLWPSICSPAPRTTCSPMAGSVGSGAGAPAPSLPACGFPAWRRYRVRFINTTGSGRCCLRSRLGVQICLYWVLNNQGCLAFAPLRGRVVLCHLQEEENQEKKPSRKCSRGWGDARLLVGCTYRGQALHGGQMCKPRNLALVPKALTTAILLLLRFLLCPFP